MRSTHRQGHLSIAGLAFMIIGLGLVIFEMQTAFLKGRIGDFGRGIVFFCGLGFSVWGLKELIAGLFPGLSKTNHSFRLPLEGWVYLVMMIVLFVGSLIGRNNSLLLVFACMAGPLVMNGWITFTMLRMLKVSRVIPDRVMAGEPFTVSIVLKNRKQWLTVWLMAVHDAITKGSGWLNAEVLFVRVPAGQERQGHYQLQLHERGRYQLGPISITSRFPLGLIERGNRLEVLDHLIVYPRIGRLTPAWRKLMQNSTELVSDVRTMAGPLNDELSRIREYRYGDDPRLIHWRTSARTNELMVCEYEESRDRDLLIIVDGWQPRSPSVEQRDDFERGLRFATTVCMDHLRSSRESSLVVKLVTAEPLLWRGDQGDSHIDQLLDSFAEAETDPDIEVESLWDIDEGIVSNRRIIVVTARAADVSQALERRSTLRFAEAQVYGSDAQSLRAVFIDLLEGER